MPKVSKAQVDIEAGKVYDRLISGLGLQKALTCNLQIGRLLRREKKRRKPLDEKLKKKKRKTNKSKRRPRYKESTDELSQLTSDNSYSSGDGCRGS